MRQALLKQALGLIAPPRCLGCLQEGTWLCRACQPPPRLGPFACVRCGRKQRGGHTCRRCARTCPLQGLISLGSYQTPLWQRGVHWLKYKGVRDVAPVLAQLLMRALTPIAPLAVLRGDAWLVPIPLHQARERERGFNQSDDLARHLATQTGVPLAAALQRLKATWTQTKVPHELRQQNLQGAFTWRAATPPPPFTILVDDVATSGATLVAAAAAVQTAGPSVVWGITVARG